MQSNENVATTYSTQNLYKKNVDEKRAEGERGALVHYSALNLLLPHLNFNFQTNMFILLGLLCNLDNVTYYLKNKTHNVLMTFLNNLKIFSLPKNQI